MYISDTSIQMRPHITFVVAAYNLRGKLKRCIETITKQTLENIEIIVVNDCSTDDTEDILNEYTNIDPRIRAINKPVNEGLSAARNTGLDAAKGEFIWHIDADDYLPHSAVAEKCIQLLNIEDAIALRFEVFEKTDENALWLENATWPRSRRKETLPEELQKAHQTILTGVIAKEFGFRSAFATIYSKDAADSLGIRNIPGTNIGEDQILISQILNKFPSIAYTPEYMYIYDKTGESMMRNKWSLNKFLEERIHTHYISESMQDKPWILESFAEQKEIHIRSNLAIKAQQDLRPEEFKYIQTCYENDISTIRINKCIEEDNIKQLLAEEALREDDVAINQLFNEIFKDTVFTYHVGAHKTATTSIQAMLWVQRYNMALEGIIYINTIELREKIRQLKVPKGEKTFSTKDIKEILISMASKYHFTEIKKVIISEENLIEFNGHLVEDWQNNVGRFTLSCCENGFRTNVLKTLLRVTPNNEIYFVARNYEEFILSQHSERCIWNEYLSIESFIGDLRLKDINWKFIITDLKEIANKLNLYFFEDIVKNLGNFCRQLTGTQLDFSDEFFPNLHALKRSRATEETLRLVNELRSDSLSAASSKKLFIKLLDYGYGNTKTRLGNKQFAEELHSKYTQFKNKYSRSQRNNELINEKKTGPFTFNLSTSSNFKLKLTEAIAEPTTSRSKQLESISHLLNKFWKPERGLDNIEGLKDFNIIRIYATPIPRAAVKNKFSCMLRVKNEKEIIKKCLDSIETIFDEIILIDNGSTDGTLKEIEDCISRSNELKKKIKLYAYPFDVAKCGIENHKTPHNSVRSLSYFYNYTLSLCSCNYVVKWDADMITTSKVRAELKKFLKDYIKFSERNSGRICLGALEGQTIYQKSDKNWYYHPDQKESEVRIFPNSNLVGFTKDILWERLDYPTDALQIKSDKITFYEYKNTEVNEFANWNPELLGYSLRKKKEVMRYQNVKNESPEELFKIGYKLL